MPPTRPANYAFLDRPEVLRVLFHPRQSTVMGLRRDGFQELRIPVAAGIRIGARFHAPHIDAPTILFFHGNGEIASDYDDIGPLFNGLKLNFIVADYRGYGISDARPTVSAMMTDCHRILSFVEAWKRERRYTGALIVMGRSLGSASALALAAGHTDRIDGLIIESGFAWAGPLLRVLGVSPEDIALAETAGLENVEKIRGFTNPTLIIHAEYDHIIPLADGEALFAASPATDKTLLTIPGANHNDIFARGLDRYLKAVRHLADRCTVSA